MSVTVHSGETWPTIPLKLFLALTLRGIVGATTDASQAKESSPNYKRCLACLSLVVFVPQSENSRQCRWQVC